jgi:hypothetical protein
MEIVDVIKAIETATSGISDKYFALPVAGLEHPLSRERVYCYELYHQMRLALSQSTFTLTAEPDKQGTPAFQKDKKPKPDLILHDPGSHENNNAVLEVECSPTKRHLIKDLRTLKLMQSKGYNHLIILLFGVSEVPWQRIKQAAEVVGLRVDEFVVFLHKTVGRPATQEHPN